MSYIKRQKSKNQSYYLEVESYRDSNGKKQHHVIRNLGKELPPDSRYRKGWNGDLLTEGKRVQVFKVKSLSMIDFMEKIGTIGEYKKQRGKEYAAVIFDEPIRNRNDWLLPFEFLGNVKQKRGGD